MSEPSNPPPTTELPPLQEDDDYVFRAQVAVTEFVLRYWTYAGYGLGLVLLAAGAYSAWSSYTEGAREEDFAAIAAIDYRMPQASVLPGVPSQDGLSDEERKTNLEEGGRRYAAAAGEASGSAAVLAWLKSAEAWRSAGNEAERAKAIEAAAALGGANHASFAADAQRVALLTDTGKPAEAETALREMAGRYSGFLAQESLMRLIELQLDTGKVAEAKTSLAEFDTRFPTPARTEALAELRARVGGA